MRISDWSSDVCSSDLNVPGVPGIGPKTAAKLINEFGDLESVLAAAPMMKKSKMQENLLAHSEMAQLSQAGGPALRSSPAAASGDAGAGRNSGRSVEGVS